MFEFEPLFFGIVGYHLSDSYNSFLFASSRSSSFFARLCIQAIKKWGHGRREFGCGDNSNNVVSFSNYTLSWYNYQSNYAQFNEESATYYWVAF